MKQITEFNTANLKELRVDIDAALAQVAAKHRIKLHIGNVRFSKAEFRTHLEGNVLSETGEKVPTIQEFDGIKYGDTFESNGRNFRVIDFMLNRPKFPIIAICKEDGKQYKFQMNVKRLIERTAALAKL